MSGSEPRQPHSRGRRRTVAALIATAAVLGPVGWLWQRSLVPDSYSAATMGYVDLGAGRAVDATGMADMPGMTGRATTSGSSAGRSAAPVRSVASLTADPSRTADVKVTLTARQARVTITPGVVVDGYTLNGTTPGPTIEAVQGQLIEVTLVNESVPKGITLHWHGVDVPNAEDGVAGVTQNAVLKGQRYTYRFVAKQAGTYWYHSHQISHEQVKRGLLGALVIRPKVLQDRAVDVPALVHLYAGHRTVQGKAGDVPVQAAPGTRVRVRVINTDNGPMSVWVTGAPYELAAIDGTDVHAPTPVSDKAVLVTAGGRADLLVTTPATGAVRVELGGSASLVIGPQGSTAAKVRRPATTLDPLSYGAPAPLGFDPDKATRHFEYAVGRRPGFVNGKPGMQWTMNGHMYPDVPMFMVAEGDIVRMTISNHSGEVHPMHLHGHHLVVLSRNGAKATGSPWWVDSLNVESGESYDVAFVADNPGIWMDHCHNLPHATQGLVAHLMYEGITEPYRLGSKTGNSPE